MKPVTAYLRSLNPDLPRAVWTLQGGGLVNAVGNGVTMPFFFIYLHNVRGFSTGLAGLVLAALGVVGLATGPVFGILVDRLGGRRMLTISLLLMAVGYGMLPLVREPWHAFAIGAIAGIGNGGFWPSQSTLLAGLTAGATRSSAYAMQRVTMNLGVGVGGLIGGLIATTSDPSSFTVLFVADAATFVVYAFVLQLVPEPEIERREAAAGSYADVLRDRAFMSFIALNVIVITAGIAQLMQILPPFMKNEAGVTEKLIGVVFFANTVFIVITQLPVAKLIEGHRRMRVLAVMALLWAASWIVVAAAGHWLEAGTAALVFGLAVVLFAVGETLHGPVWGPVIADLAPPQLRGRYLALSASSWGIGFVIGPAVGGLLLGWNPSAVWILSAAVLVGAAAYALALERFLPEGVRRAPARRAPREPMRAPAVAEAPIQT